MARKKNADNLDRPLAAASEALEGGSEEALQQLLDQTSKKQEESGPVDAGSEQKSQKAQEAVPAKKPAPEVDKQDDFGGDYNKLHKSYKEAYAWNTRMAQELAELKGKVEGMASVGQAQRQPQAQPTMTQEQFNEWYSRDPLSASAWLATSIAEKRAEKTEATVEALNRRLGGFISKAAEGSFKSRYSDIPELEEELNSEMNRLFPEVRRNPELYAEVYDQALETAYWTLKGKKTKQTAEQAKSQGRQEAETNFQKRKEALVEGGGKAPSEPPLDLKNASSDDILKYGQAIGISIK